MCFQGQEGYQLLHLGPFSAARNGFVSIKTKIYTFLRQCVTVKRRFRLGLITFVTLSLTRSITSLFVPVLPSLLETVKAELAGTKC